LLFNSIDFAIFLPIVFALYWLIPTNRLARQNLLLLVSSYVFYGWWDYRFLFLLAFSTLLDYFSGLKIAAADSQRERKFWMILSVVVNLGFLGFFKYYNFFIESFAGLLTGLGVQANPWTLQIILPVGISFYTFHGLSYVFDCYNRKVSPVTNFIDYAVFVCFFPLLVAGPIERATHLLPQIRQERKFEYGRAVDGMRQILWGLFKKIVIADNCAVFANSIFSDSATQSGSTLVMGALFFTFQIYCDFSGYSDIALGTARLFGFELLRNFAFPYFSRDIAEFWRRWHISLSSWFRDYLYLPLGGSRGGTWRRVRNTFIIFLVSGFWHGANWTFIAWGLLNAFYFLPLLLANKNRDHIEIVAKGKMFPELVDIFRILITFTLTVFAWIFFRAENLSHAFQYIGGIFSISLFTVPNVFPVWLLVFIALFMCVEWIGRANQYAIQHIGVRLARPIRWGFYYALIALIIIYMGVEQEFIYFQF
jgi:alginate O-acetyltransferase complex protein AlgI